MGKNSLFKDDCTRSQASDKLTFNKFGPFTVKSMIGKNAVDFDLPRNLKRSNVFNIMNAVPYFDQPEDVSAEVPNKPDPVPKNEGDEYVDKAILKHCKKGSVFRFVTLMKGDPSLDAELQIRNYFTDSD